MVPDFTVGQGDRASALTDQLLDANGVGVNITGAAVTLRLVPLEGGTAIVNDLPAQITDAASGQVRRDWLAGETDRAGLYLGNWRVTFTGGVQQRFPNDGYFLLHVSPTAPLALGSTYLSLEDAKDTLELGGLRFADKDLQRSLVAASRAVDHETRRQFYRSASTVRTFRATRRDLLPIDDLVTFTLLETADVIGGTWTAWTQGTEFQLEPQNAPADGHPYTRVRALQRSFWVPSQVRITGVWGWPALPEEIVQATQIIATQLLRRVREAPFGVIGIGIDGQAVRMSKIDPQIAQLLGPYRRRLTLA